WSGYPWSCPLLTDSCSVPARPGGVPAGVVMGASGQVRRGVLDVGDVGVELGVGAEDLDELLLGVHDTRQATDALADALGGREAVGEAHVARPGAVRVERGARDVRDARGDGTGEHGPRVEPFGELHPRVEARSEE